MLQVQMKRKEPKENLTGSVELVYNICVVYAVLTGIWKNNLDIC